MAFADSLMPRLRAAGLTVHDIRGVLPRRGTWMARPVSAITIISQHWDAEHRPRAYDSVARYKGQANYHINKDWGGGAHGDGLQYHIKIDNVGDVFITRDFEHVLWNISNANYNGIGLCYDGTTGQNPTREQATTFDKLNDVLTTQCPEFPAGQANVKGHQEIPSNSTACPGTFMTPVREYRASGNVNAAQYAYDYPPAPAPAPTPTPAPTPPPPPPPKPASWKPIDGGKRSMIVNQDTVLFEVPSGARTTSSYPKGKQIDNLVEEYVSGAQTYWRTEYSASKGISKGFKREHLSEVPAPTPPPTPTPTPVPTPTPEPTPTNPDTNAIVAFLEMLGKLITDFLAKFKKG